MRKFGLKQGLIALALVAGVSMVFVGKALAGFSPADRPTFTWENAAPYITFNSITNNPVAGDERPFLDGKVTTAAGNNVDKINVKDNDEVVLRVYFHNNAKANLNLVSTNTKVKILLPKTAKTATFAAGYITSDNANPRVVADTVDFTGERPFNIEYIPGSARITTNALNNVAISDSVVTDGGALIGFNAIDGRVPGCAQFSGWVTIRAKVKMPTEEKPAFKCDALNTTISGRKVDANVAFTATGGATFKSTTFDWGDGNKDTVNTTSASHTYGADGTFTINATLAFDVGGTEKTSVCTKSVTITTPPVTPPVKPPVTPPAPTPPVPQVGKALPVTGPAGIAGLFAGVSTLAGAIHYMWGRRFGA
ncbi:PKD domain-containing protein [Candidatus Saccharibacteria bacterium]|nr:PKD domain-containing protein [Candidatus Saccharibacteria bacterium]